MKTHTVPLADLQEPTLTLEESLSIPSVVAFKARYAAWLLKTARPALVEPDEED